MMNKSFDLIEYLDLVHTCSSPKRLYEIWDEVCRFYDRGRIGSYELDEMKTAIWPSLRNSSLIQREVDRRGHYSSAMI